MSRVCLHVTAGYFPDPLVEVRRHGANSYATFWDRLEPEAIAFEDLLTEALTPSQRAALRHRIGRAWSSVSYHHLRAGSAQTAARAAARALLYPGYRGRALKHLALLPWRGVLRTSSSPGVPS
jgi:hypothetical protein